MDHYHGNGKRGFREWYRRLLDTYPHKFFADNVRLVDVTPRTLAQFVAWLADESKQGQRLADSTIANAVVPARAALATAKREGTRRHNPATGLALPRREEVRENDEEQTRALSRAQLAALLAMFPPRHALFAELMASTGLRVSETIALQRRHWPSTAPLPTS